jgi:NAD(P)-dependent dehydrogenase (short-subunit alcohol dehydrogenase family)
MIHGKVSLVTGANAGMGKAIAIELARQGATVVMVARDRHKGERAKAEIEDITGNLSIELLIADLSSQQAIRQLAREVKQQYSQLHILVNNAGAHFQQRRISVDGIEMNLAINHLASFLLTNLLLDLMLNSAPARIVNVASAAMTRSIDLDDLQSEQKFVPFDVYGRAKLQMVLCTYTLARKLAGTHVTVNALHPGITATTMVDDVAPTLARPFMGIIKHFLSTPVQGAQTAIYLATSPAVEGITGKYFIKGKQAQSVPISYDEVLQAKVWNSSADLVGLVR